MLTTAEWIKIEWGIIIACAIIFFIIIYVIVADRIRNRRVPKITETEPRAQAEPAVQPKARREDFFRTYVALSGEGVERVQLIQLRTNTESGEEVLDDALKLYSAIVSVYDPGDKLAICKFSDGATTTVILDGFKPLQRMGKRTKS